MSHPEIPTPPVDASLPAIFADPEYRAFVRDAEKTYRGGFSDDATRIDYKKATTKTLNKLFGKGYRSQIVEATGFGMIADNDGDILETDVFIAGVDMTYLRTKVIDTNIMPYIVYEFFDLLPVDGDWRQRRFYIPHDEIIKLKLVDVGNHRDSIEVVNELELVASDSAEEIASEAYKASTHEDKIQTLELFAAMAASRFKLSYGDDTVALYANTYGMISGFEDGHPIYTVIDQSDRPIEMRTAAVGVCKGASFLELLSEEQNIDSLILDYPSLILQNTDEGVEYVVGILDIKAIEVLSTADVSDNSTE